MAKKSAHKQIERNADRVHISYDVEAPTGTEKVELPFVMGVLSDLSGKPAQPLPPVSERSFLEIDAENFDARLKASTPRVAFNVPNRLTDEGNLGVELTFESMDDFSPAAVASKVEGCKQLLEARTQLKNLLTYMDGKSGAENLITRLLNDPALLQSLASAPKPIDSATTIQSGKE